MFGFVGRMSMAANLSISYDIVRQTDNEEIGNRNRLVNIWREEIGNRNRLVNIWREEIGNRNRLIDSSMWREGFRTLGIIVSTIDHA
jgi:hypothetical protein